MVLFVVRFSKLNYLLIADRYQLHAGKGNFFIITDHCQLQAGKGNFLCHTSIFNNLYFNY
jgi:hypothetical protein